MRCTTVFLSIFVVIFSMQVGYAQVSVVSIANAKGGAVDQKGFPANPEGTYSNATGGSVVELYNRVEILQQTVSKLTADIELLKHQNQELKDRLAKQESSSVKGAPSSQVQDSANASSAATRIEDKFGRTSLSEKDFFDNAYNLMLNKDYVKAEDAFNEFVQTYPRSAKASDALYWVGEMYYSQEKYVEASKAYVRSSRTYPNGDKAAESILHLSYSLKHLSQLKEACRMAHYLSSNYHDHRDKDAVFQAKSFYNENACYSIEH